MARLLVDAVSREISGADHVYALELLVSVSRASSGVAVTGLTKSDFRICHHVGNQFDFRIGSPVSELEWEPGDTVPSGCYALSLYLKPEGTSEYVEWGRNHFYAFGVGVRWYESSGQTPGGLAYGQFHEGQTVVRVQSLGV